MSTIEAGINYAQAAIEAGSDDSGEIETRIADTLANIMHYCDDQGIDFDTMLNKAEVYHDEEKFERCLDEAYERGDTA